jgi:FtsH-binding integral membrane protein
MKKSQNTKRGGTSGSEHPGTAAPMQTNQRMGEKEMKKIMQTLLLAAFVVLTTASFSYAEYAATGDGNFPYFHLGCLIVGGLIILSLKNRYPRLYLSEAIGSFALYTVLVALFTSPVVDALKTVVG